VRGGVAEAVLKAAISDFLEAEAEAVPIGGLCIVFELRLFSPPPPSTAAYLLGVADVEDDVVKRVVLADLWLGALSKRPLDQLAALSRPTLS